MNRRGVAPALVLLMAAASLSALVGAPTATAAAPGTLSTFAGGLGAGRATTVAQTPWALTARNGRLVSIEGNFPLPPSGGTYARPGLVRALDLASGTQTVLAGILTGGFRGDGGPGPQAQLNFPTDAAIDAVGNVYITDTDNHRIRKVTPSGTITTFAGNGVAGFSGEGAAATSASLNRPGGITLSPSGDVIFADQGNYRIRKVSPSGTMTTIAGTGGRTGPAGDGSPATAVALDARALESNPGGGVYFVDFLHSNSLRRILVDGTITTVATPPSFSGAMTVDGSGNLYLSASPGIVRIDPSGTVTPVAGTTRPVEPGEDNGDGGPALDAHLSTGHDLAVEGGNLYLTDHFTHRIRRVDSAGMITTVAGNGVADFGGDGGQALGAQFPNVSIVRSGPTGTYVYTYAERDLGRIRHIDPAGVVSTIHEGSVADLAVDDAGNVYFSGDHRVRRLAPSGELSTVAGTGAAGFSGDGGPALLARLDHPSDLAVDNAGNLYVFDAGNRRMRRVDSLGVISTHVDGSATGPRPRITLASESSLGQVGDTAVDSQGSLHWTEHDGTFGVIRKVRCGIVSTVTRYRGTGPAGLVIDAVGSVFFPVGNEVRRAEPSGTVSVVAGTGGSVLLEGLPATSVELRTPTGAAIHPSGRLLFGHAGRVLQIDGVTAGRAVAAPPCETRPDRPAWGTGYNALGQLGDGTTTDRAGTSGDDPPLTGVTAVTGGVGHSVALRTDGTVWAWGSNDHGQVGDGTGASRLRPVPVAGLTGVVALAGGAFHTLALKSDGTVWAWGWNPLGQLGDGTTTQRLRPVPVPGLTNVVAISAGTLHSLAARSDGSVWSWGWNGVGQLGDGTVVDHRFPARVPGLTGATGVAAGGLHSLAVTADGSVWAWGWNQFGQLGDGTTAERHVPGQVWGLVDAKAVAAGSYHSLVLKQGGRVAAWGFGNVHQLGNHSHDSSLIPVGVRDITGVAAVAAGAFHSLALLDDGRVLGWGWNYFGQLAHGTAFEQIIPQELGILDHAAAMGAGAYHSLFAYRFPA